MTVLLAKVYRGYVLESTHSGSIAVVDSKGNILYKLGNEKRVTFFHSSAKPLQALAVLETGIVEEFGLDLKEVAIMASSHSGEKEHIDVLTGIMKKLDVSEEMLRCGAHDPLSKEAAKELYAEGRKPGKLHCNCSGKHLGFMAASKLKGYPVDDYHLVESALQAEIRETISLFGGVNARDIVIGTDGCGVPVYGMPLLNMARAYANLCNDKFHDGKFAKSQNYIISAMTMYPEAVAGKGRFDTEMMRHFGERIIVKTGAEGVCCAGLPGKGVGIALKIEDGAQRATEPVMLEILLQLKVIKGDEINEVEKFRHPAILSHSGDKIGEIRPAFRFDA